MVVGESEPDGRSRKYHILYRGNTRVTKTRNLATLAGTGAFEEALHSLTAAIHLMTARSAAPPAGAASLLGPRSGAAA